MEDEDLRLPSMLSFVGAGMCRPLDKDCPCMTCKKYTRALLHNLVAKGIPFAAMLVSLHNVAYTQRLTQQIRDAISQQRFPEFVQKFVRGHFPAGTEVPQWVFDALAECGISVP